MNNIHVIHPTGRAKRRSFKFVPNKFSLQQKKVTKKCRPVSFALRVPEFLAVAYAHGLMRHPGAQGYNAENNKYLPYQQPEIQQTKKGGRVKRKKQKRECLWPE